MLELAENLDDPDEIVDTALAQMAQQGALPTAVTAERGAAPPPRTIHHQSFGSCDIDDDGTRDMIVNKFDLDHSPPDRYHGGSTVQAISSEDGQILWSKDNHVYYQPSLPGDFTMQRPGAPVPREMGNVVPSEDVDGDGVCDPLVYGLELDSLSPPIVGGFRHMDVTTNVALLSGADGSTIWERTFTATQTDVQEPFFQTAGATVVRGMPTGFLHYPTPDGPRFVLKTSDVRFFRAQDPLGFTGAVLDDPFHATEMRVNENIRVHEVETGERLWQRNLTNAQGAQTTNLTWLTGVADLTGDDHPELVLDQFMLTTPRGSEARDPLTGEPIFRFDRGMRVLALQGSGDGAGQTLWSRYVMEPGAPEPNPGFEENFEQPIWGHARIIGDLNDDDTPDVLAQYLAREESASVTPVQALRTHFVPLDGETGAQLWDTKIGGWGFGRTLEPGNGTAPQLLVGTVDLPVSAGGQGRFPPLSTRVTALTADEGQPEWSHEMPFADHSFEAVQVALRQYQHNLAPFDVTEDGTSDVISAAQNVPPQGPNQQLLATQTHTYDLVSGGTGDEIGQVETWGGLGLVLTCGSTENEVTVVSGHPRRLQLTRINLTNGTVEWEETIWNNPSPRTPSNGIDMLGMQARCHSLDDDSTLYTVNVDAYSYQRQAEVISIVGKIDPQGERAWQRPRVASEPADQSRLAAQSAVIQSDEGRPWTSLGVAAGIAALSGLLATLGWARWRDAPQDAWLTIAIALLMVSTTIPGTVLAGGSTGLGGSSSTSIVGEASPRESAQPPSQEALENRDRSPAGENGSERVPGERGQARLELVRRLAELGVNGSFEAQLDAYQRYFHDVGYPVPAPGAAAREDPRAKFGDNTTIGYTHTIGDIDGDGIEDAFLDLYCTECFAADITLDSPTSVAEAVVEGTTCGSPHGGVAISGANGSALWSKNLDEPTPPGYAGCAREFLMGTTPLPSGATGLLVYRLEVRRSPFFSVNSDPYAHTYTHTLYMLDATTGENRWSYTVNGTRAGLEQPGYAGDTFLLQPILQTPSNKLESGLNPGNESALFVQGIGAVQTVVEPTVTPPGFSSFVLVDNYQPNEWAARIDLGTGEEAWRTGTYTPQPNRSVLPRTLDIERTWGSGFEQRPEKRDSIYWSGSPCCGDLTGDGVPDLVYSTDEWSSTPMTETDGPFRVASSLRVYDGATGEQLYDVTLADDVPTDNQPPKATESNPTPFLEVSLKDIGDVDGDGGGEIVVRRGDLAWRPNYTLAVRDGDTGEVLWNQSDVQRPRSLVLGDVNEDGAPDLAMAKWYAWEHTNELQADRTTLQELPIRVVSGKDGSTLWRGSSFTAPGDFEKQLRTFEAKGRIDVDQDGVADLVQDDPLQLDDQTTVHRLSILSGRNGTELWSTDAAGTFAHLSSAPDIDGDGVEDVALVSGDVNDLWLTMLGGDDGNPLWSRRLLNVPVSSYAEAFPKITVHPLAVEDGPDNALLNMHLSLTSFSTVYVISVTGESGQQAWETQHLAPQMALVDGPTGQLGWSMPSADDPDASLVLGHTPATQTFQAFEEDLDEDVSTQAAETARDATPWAIAVLSGIVVGILVAIGAIGVMRRRRELKEVPELGS